MKKSLYLITYFAILIFGISLFAQDADKAKSFVKFFVNELLTTEQSYQKGLGTLLRNMDKHEEVFKKALADLQSSAIKKTLSTSKIKKLTQLIAEMDKTFNILQGIRVTSLTDLGPKIIDLKKKTENFDPKELHDALYKIGIFFLDDGLYLRPYKEFTTNYAKFKDLYLGLFKEYSDLLEKDGITGNFYSEVDSFLILAVQRGPRYPLILGEVAKHIETWAKAYPDNKDLTNLKNVADQLLKTVKKKTGEFEKLIPPL
jgi:hypothetical protein